MPADYAFTAADNGVHTFTVTLVTAGSQNITATDKINASLLGTATVNVTPGPVDQLVFGQQPTNVAPGMAISPAVTVRLLDHYNNLVTSDNTDLVTIAIGANPGSGVLSGTTTATVSGGVATFGNLSISQPGSGYTLVGTLGKMTATSASFNVAVATSSVIESFDGSRTYYVVGGVLRRLPSQQRPNTTALTACSIRRATTGFIATTRRFRSSRAIRSRYGCSSPAPPTAAPILVLGPVLPERCLWWPPRIPDNS